MPNKKHLSINDNGSIEINDSSVDKPGIIIQEASKQKPYWCTLSDDELTDKARVLLDELVKTGGRSFVMHIPARPNEDIDIIFADLIGRFKKMKTELSNAQEQLDNLESIN